MVGAGLGRGEGDFCVPVSNARLANDGFGREGGVAGVRVTRTAGVRPLLSGSTSAVTVRGSPCRTSSGALTRTAADGPALNVMLVAVRISSTWSSTTRLDCRLPWRWWGAARRVGGPIARSGRRDCSARWRGRAGGRGWRRPALERSRRLLRWGAARRGGGPIRRGRPRPRRPLSRYGG